MKNKLIVITGGAGAIGGNLVSTLSSEKSNRIIVIDNLSSGKRHNCPEKENVKFYRGSILNDNLLEKIFLRSTKRVNIIFHLAAHFANQNSVEHPQEDLLTNSLGTIKVLEYARKAGAERFVYASSSCVYGNTDAKLKEDFISNLETPYAISKLSGEEYVHFYHNFHKLNAVVLRYFNAFGPLDTPGKYRNVVPNFMLRALRKEPLMITGTGNETRDFTYMDDVVRGTILAAEVKKASGQIFNIGTGREIKIRYVAQLINKITANTAGIKFIKRRKWDNILKRVADIGKSKRLLGYSPSVSFEEGLRRTFEWFKVNYS